MKAVYIEKFGDESVMQIGEVATPLAKENEVLIAIDYTAVNPVDWKIREGHLQELLPHIFPIIPGWDVAGTVKSAGKNVSRFKEGDRVFAYARKETVQHGTYAEFISLNEKSVALAPKSIPNSAAAALPLVALTAYQALNEFIGLKKGESILITAGAGGVGSIAIQLAKNIGATVITTASEKNHGYLKEIGADHVIDYHNADVAVATRELFPDGVDAVFDGAGYDSLKNAYKALKQGGRVASIVESPDEQVAKELGGKFGFVFVAPNGEQLKEIASLLEEGKLKLPAINEMSIRDAKRALTMSKAGRTRGKVVLKIDF